MRYEGWEMGDEIYGIRDKILEIRDKTSGMRYLRWEMGDKR